MVITESDLGTVLTRLMGKTRIALDTETFGLRPYHGDRLFSIILADDEGPVYLNFYPNYPDNPPCLNIADVRWKLRTLFQDPTKTWYMHNASFDMHMLAQDGIELAGQIHCTMVQARVEYNEHLDYSLDACLRRIGLEKDDKVKAWINENDAKTKVALDGKQTTETRLHFERVPFDIIVPYGLADARGTYALGVHQEKSIDKQVGEFPPGAAHIRDACRIERRLARTVFNMERRGVRVDLPYCRKASDHERGLAEASEAAFKHLTGKPYLASPKLFSEIFESEKTRWKYTEKGNPSFESGVLSTFEHPAAQAVLAIRGAKSRSDFYQGFLYHADQEGYVHPRFNSGGTRTLRFSSSSPNFQNLTNEEDDPDKAYVVRRALIPTEGTEFWVLDFKSMEYSMMLDYAKAMMIQELNSRNIPWVGGYFEIANKVRDGYDIHQATAEMMGVSRKYAKTLNFMLLYGGGVAKLAGALGVTLDAAQELRAKYFKALPYVQFMMKTVSNAIKTRGWTRSWAGYRYQFPDRNFAYTGPNTVIQGGCAAVTKVAMNQIDEYLKDKTPKLLMTVHDELVIEGDPSNRQLFREIVKIAENVYPHKYVPLKCSAFIGVKSYADLEEFI